MKLWKSMGLNHFCDLSPSAFFLPTIPGALFGHREIFNRSIKNRLIADRKRQMMASVEEGQLACEDRGDRPGGDGNLWWPTEFRNTPLPGDPF